MTITKTLRAVLLAALGWSLATGPLHAQTWFEEGPGPILFGQIEGITDRPVVGDIQAIAPHPTDPNRILAGAVNGGIWETLNALDSSPTWQRAFLPPAHDALSIMDIAYDPTDVTHMTVWAAVGEASSFGRVGSSRLGLLKSTDGGFSFSYADLSLQGKRLVNVLPRGNIVVAAAEDSDAFSCPTLGLFRSTDGGTTFTQIPSSSGFPGGVVDSLIGVPGTPNFMLASVNFANACSPGSSNGVYFSSDSGATWVITSSAAMNALIEDGTDTNVKMSFGPNSTYFVGIVPASTKRLGGVFSSANGGPWIAMDLPGSTESVAGFQGIHPGGQGNSHFALVADPSNIGIVYISGDRQPCKDEPTCTSAFPNAVGANDFTGRLFKGNSLAATGSQWTPLTHSGTFNGSAPHADSRDMEFDVQGNLIESDDGGIYKRTTPINNFGDWSSLNGDIQVTEYYSIAYDPIADIIIGGAQDTGTSRQFVPGPGRDPWNEDLGADGGDVAIDTQWLNAPAPCPALTDFSVRYQSFQELGFISRWVFDASNTFRCLNDLSGMLSPAGPVVPQFNTAIEVNADVGMRLVIGAANGVFESLDGGTTVGLVATSPAVTLVAQPGHKKPIAYGAPGNTEALYVGGCEPGFVNCGLWVRTDTGLPLTKITSAPFNVARSVNSVVMDPDDSSTVFVIADDNIYRSTTFGSSWTNITNLPATALGTPVPISLEYVNPARGSDFLVVGTKEDGVFSAPAGDLTNWAAYGTSLAQAHVFKLEYDRSRDKLVAGLLGRGAWSLQCSDDFEPDDVQGDATPIVSGVPQTHSLCPLAELDYTTFSLTQESEVTITALSTDPVFLQLLDNTGSPIEDATTTAGIDRTCGVDALPAGTYYVYAQDLFADGKIIVDSYEFSYTSTPCPSADVSVTKTLDTSGPYLNGQQVQYTIVVSNAGPDSATNVSITDTPTNLTLDSVSSTNCSALPCTLSSLANGASETITVTATINSFGSFDNAVTVAADELDPNTGNNTANDGSTAAAAADISVTKTLDTFGPYLNRQSVQFTIVVSNAGPDTASSVTVTDTPTNLTLDSVSSTNCSALPCLLASLTSGSSETITVMATIDSAGSFDNAVGVSANEADPNTSNNTANAGSTAVAAADISVTKSLDTSGPFTTGQSVQYTIAVSNAGPDTATNVMVSDTPTNLTLGSVSSTNCSALPCTVASLAGSASELITVNATINSAGSFDNAVSVTAFEADPNTGNNSANDGSTAIDPMASADLSVTKALDTTGPFAVGQTVQFSVVVSNAGPDTASSVTVTDTPTNLTLGAVSSSPSGACTALPCVLTNFTSGASETITVTATIDALGVFENAVSIVGTVLDPDENNNADSVTGEATVVSEPEIDVQGNGVSTPMAIRRRMPRTTRTLAQLCWVVSVVRSFTIRNTGTSNLNLTGTPLVSVTGSGFAVTSQPGTSVIAADGSTTFEVTFMPGVVGSSTGVIFIQNDDSDESPYDFVIGGQGTANNTAPTLVDATFEINDALFVGQTVGVLIATDSENNIPATGAYQITGGNTGGAFAVQDDGAITVADEMALTGNFTLTVQVTDSGGLSDTATITVDVAQILILRDDFGSGFF